MEGNALFNPGFLGASFLWWVGQIADDSTWRDNINSGKYEDKNSVPGWGRRYKVRIIGLHDQGEEQIPSDQLPWANVMYPITAGGGQSAASQTANLRQGNMVFGFFLDGQDQQVPVIMGILGNNSQTVLSQVIGDNAVTNAQAGSIAKSGYSTGAIEKSGSAREIPPDEDKTIKKPGGNDSPNSAVRPGATFENADGIHQITAADVKRQEKCEEKIVMLKPDDTIGCAIKGIQTTIENLVRKIDKYLQSLQSYVDAVSNVIDDIRSVLKNYACEIAKYMKIIFDKIMEYVLKVLNKSLNNVVNEIPSSFRYQFSDMKEVFTELILCLYNKLVDGLCDKIAAALNSSLNLDELEQDARDRSENGQDQYGNENGEITNPQVPMCYAEDLVSVVLSGSKNEIDEANNNLIDNMNAYLDDVSELLSGVTGVIGDIRNLIPDISGSITSALSFSNISLNVFGCEIKPNVALSDFYTFCEGGDSQPQQQLPSFKSIGDAIDPNKSVESSRTQPYVEPTRATTDINLSSDSSTQEQINSRISGIA